tara:strand:- start:2805 stop:3905 length:1101 start_codon:yes stop_codon:yes gene_type:complete
MLDENGTAIIFQGSGKPLEKVVYQIPKKIEPDEILVKISLSTVCGSDLHTWLGQRPFPTNCILGHEIVGKIVNVGEKVKEDYVGNQLTVGDRITWSMTIGCNDCFFCNAGLPQKCYDMFKYGHVSSKDPPHFTGGFAQYIVLKKGTYIFKIPTTLSDKEVAPLMCVGATVVSGLSASNFQPCDFVVIQGVGAFGLYACAFTKQLGAKTVIAIDKIDKRLELAKQFGADFVININSNPDPVKEVRKITSEQGADFVIEMTGDPTVVKQGIEMLRIGGKYVILGAIYPNSNITIDVSMIILKCIEIFGMHNYHPTNLKKAIELVVESKKKFPYEKLVGPDFQLSVQGVEDALTFLNSKKSIRPAIIDN